MFEALLIIALIAFLAHLGVFKLLGALIGLAFDVFGLIAKAILGIVVIILLLSMFVALI